MGDVAMSVPVLRALLQQNPNVKITILSRKFLQPLFKDLPNTNFYSAEVRDKHKGFFGLFRLFQELSTLKIGAVADIHNVLRSKVIRLFFSISLKKIAVINKGRAEKKALTRTENKIFKQLKTTTERYADVFRTLGFSVDLSHPYFPAKKEIPEKVKISLGLEKTQLIGIAPFAQYSSKMYPLDLMTEVIAELSQNKNYKILLFGGGQKEIEVLKNIEAKFENVISLAGKFKFSEELNIISNLDCMLSMDSGNAHLAAMFGVKTITIWGVTHPFTGFYPFHQPIKYAILPDLKKYPNIPCSIYGNKVCKGYENVMRSIPSKNVIKKINEIL
jgi:ADP-heptose:LPS heptosyltransferase